MQLAQALEAAGFDVASEPIRRLAFKNRGEWRWDPRDRADLLNHAFVDPSIDAILDLSGGDLANEVLPFLDWDVIASNPKPMVGYSDLSCVLGSLPFRSLLWNPRVGIEHGFAPLEVALEGSNVRPAITALETGEMASDHPVVDAHVINALPWLGGNIRCFLKLAGTENWPDLTRKVLVIEALHLSLSSLAALLAHHTMLGTWDYVAGVVVGQLTSLDEASQRDAALHLIGSYTSGLPLFAAPGLGHSMDSEAVTLG